MIIILFTTILAFLFSLFATLVISYVALATPIGPWMEMTLVLMGIISIKLVAYNLAITTQMRSIALATAAGGIGGAVAMACAFSFPTLYFLDQTLFNSWMGTPFIFCSLLAALVFAAGSFGFLIAGYLEKKLLADDTMVFPIGRMVYTMIAAQNQLKKAHQLALGGALSLGYGILQTVTTLLPARLTLLPALSWNIFSLPLVTTRTDMIPMFWAIGFTTGHVIALPLLVAVVARLALIDPVHTLFFRYLSHSDYVLAFGAGMAIQGALLSLIDIPKGLGKIFKNFSVQSLGKSLGTLRQAQGERKNKETVRGEPVEPSKHNKKSCLILIPIAFLTYFSFSVLAQCYLLAATAVCGYQLLVIAGKLGIAPLGRFATFVMIPGLLLFGFNAIQVTILATFVELAGVVAVDMMFGQKVAQLANINRRTMHAYQWIGLAASAVSVGAIFWLLITHFGLGSPELIASRAQSRAVLVNAFHFDYLVMILGFIFSYCLKYSGVNPTLVFGGLLMGLDTSLMLIAGGLSTYLVKEKEEQYPFWSGVYATNSLWIFIKMLF